MAANGSAITEVPYKTVKTVLVSQPKPERSPYYELEKKYGVTIDWRPFIHVEGVEARDFRKQKVRIEEFSAVIFTSKNAVEHFFRLCTEMRVAISQELKYFCLTEQIANYLQHFIVYRKRKVFHGERKIEDMASALKKHKATERFLLPCSNLGALDVTQYLNDNNFDWKEGMMFQTVSSDLSDLSNVTYDVLVFFSPQGIQSLFENFPDFKQNDTRIAVFGTSTAKAVEEAGLSVDILAPAPEAPSMTAALGNYLKLSNPVVG